MAAEPILFGLGQAEALGAQPEGTAFAGQFQPGDVLEQPINVQPGKCYTVVAAGIGVEVSLQIVAQPAPMMPPQVVAQSQAPGPTTVVGGRASGCWRSPYPTGFPAKIVLTAARGSGMAAAKVFTR
jgi:hypothetical protein